MHHTGLFIVGGGPACAGTGHNSPSRQFHWWDGSEQRWQRPSRHCQGTSPSGQEGTAGGALSTQPLASPPANLPPFPPLPQHLSRERGASQLLENRTPWRVTARPPESVCLWVDKKGVRTGESKGRALPPEHCQGKARPEVSGAPGGWHRCCGLLSFRTSPQSQ